MRQILIAIRNIFSLIVIQIGIIPFIICALIEEEEFKNVISGKTDILYWSSFKENKKKKGIM